MWRRPLLSGVTTAEKKQENIRSKNVGKTLEAQIDRLIVEAPSKGEQGACSH